MAYTNYQWTNPSAIPTYQSPSIVSSYYSQQNNGIVWVQGESGAKAYPVPPGNTVLLMDSESSIFYIKSTDSSGIPQPLRTFEYTERTQTVIEEKEKDYVTREEFDDLKKLLDDLTK